MKTQKKEEQCNLLLIILGENCPKTVHKTALDRKQDTDIRTGNQTDWQTAKQAATICPRRSDPLCIVFLLYKTGHYFLAIQKKRMEGPEKSCFLYRKATYYKKNGLPKNTRTFYTSRFCIEKFPSSHTFSKLAEI